MFLYLLFITEVHLPTINILGISVHLIDIIAAKNVIIR